jgi:protein phosphatase 1 regulatory subunit 32
MEFLIAMSPRFTDRTPQGIERMGHTWGGVQPQKSDGFTRSTGVHNYGPNYNSTSVMRNLEPYVAR